MSNETNRSTNTDPDAEIAEAFRQAAPLRGLSADDLGKTFQHKDMSYHIVGLQLRNTKLPIICTSPDAPGRRYKFPTWLVKDVLRGLHPLPPVAWTGRATRRVVGAS